MTLSMDFRAGELVDPAAERRRHTRFRMTGAAACALAALVGLALAPAPGSAQGLALEAVGEISGPAELVRVRGDRAYVSGGHVFTIYDVSDPSRPVALGSHTFPQEIWGFRLTGDRAYVGANFFGLGILDISGPGAPVLLGEHKTLGQAKIGATASGKVGIIDHMEGFVLVDISDETAPSGIGSFFLDGYARDVVTDGTLAFATDSPSGLYVFDLARSGLPEPVGVLHAPNAPRDIDVSPATAERPTLIVGAGGGDVQVYDVSDPAMPEKVASVSTPGRATRVSMNGDEVFVADTEAGVSVVDVSDPGASALVGTFPTPRPTRDVSADGSLVAVVVGDSEREGHDRWVVLLERR
jgi:hypothetical protein